MQDVVKAMGTISNASQEISNISSVGESNAATSEESSALSQGLSLLFPYLLQPVWHLGKCMV